MKHAFLIMAHNQFDFLGRLLEAIDHEDHYIFLHIDAKAKNVDIEALRSNCVHAPITFIRRQSVFWGGFSQIICEVNLLKAASAQGPFDYYHLMSGVDYPIQSLWNIHSFFQENNGKEFLEIATGWAESPDIRVRYQYYQLFQDTLLKRTKNPFLRFVHDRLNAAALSFQMNILHTDRTKKPSAPKAYYGGMNWFSITDDLCKWVLSKERWIRTNFRFTSNADEIFLHCIFMDSPFAGNLYQYDTQASDCGSKRLVDWERGKPYIWQKEDYEELIASKCLFARKFQYSTEDDIKLIDMLWNHIKA